MGAHADRMSDPLHDHFVQQFALVVGVGWLGLLLWNQLVWAFVTLTIVILGAGYFISRFVFGIHGWTNLTLSSACCGSSIVVIIWLMFRAFA
jgi:hypothetical protein